MKCQLCLAPYAFRREFRAWKEVMVRLFKLLKAHGLYVIRDLIILKVGISLILGTAFYLYKFNRNKESYVMNIMLATFVSRVTGLEFI